MKTALFILLVMFLFSSCATQKRMDRKCRKALQKYELAAYKYGCPMVSDSFSSFTQVIIKDTTIYVPVPGETVHDSIPVIISKGLVNSPISKLETSYSISKAWVENGLLWHTLDQKSATIPVTIPGAMHNITSGSVQTIKVPYHIVRQISKPLSWWQKLFFWSGIIAWWAGVGFLILKFKRFSL
jgi:hypothetical protein